MAAGWTAAAPSRNEIDAMPGPLLLEFGTTWCGHCRAAQPLIDRALADHPQVRYLQVIDGPGEPLGRSFGVKLWPTLVFLRDGREVGREVRPRAEQPIRDGLNAIAPAP